MSQLREVKAVGNLEFSWGKKQSFGSTEDCQYYESFTYDGLQYLLYDSVYLWRAGESEPYVAKLIKMWETENHKFVKVVWFLRPNEIRDHLRGLKPGTKEVFLACGEGKGLSNINPLEAISGKCNVVCTSVDRRNPRASSEELRIADHIFFRTFNVGNNNISEKFPDVIAGLKVEHLFNKRNDEKLIPPPKLERNLEERSRLPISSSKLETNSANRRELKGGQFWRRKYQEVKEANIPALSLGKQTCSSYKSIMMSGAAKTSGNQVGDKTKARCSEDLSPESESDVRVLKKRKFQGGLKEDIANISNRMQQPPDIELKSLSRKYDSVEKNESTTRVISNVKMAPAHRNDHVGKLKGEPDQMRRSRVVEHNSLSAKHVSVNKASTNGVNLCVKPLNFPKPDDAQLEPHKGELDHMERARGNEQNSWRKADICENKQSTKSVKFNMKTCKASEQGDGQVGETKSVTEVSTKRSVLDSSNWFKQQSWEERIRKAHGAGSLVVLDNLDPSYTSLEVEDIVRDTLKKNVSAKMIRHRTFSSPRYGQALVIFKSKDDADFALSELNRKCLVLGGRPVVGRRGTLREPGNSSRFAGHLVIGKLKFQKKSFDGRKAVSTSHCSQPNTIEYEMAMEWRVLQEKARLEWDALHKQQAREIEHLKKREKPLLHKQTSMGAARKQ